MSLETVILAKHRDLQLLQDLDGMERRIRRGWTRKKWVRPGFPWASYCLTGAMNKQVIGKAMKTAKTIVTPSMQDRRINVLHELGFGSFSSAESWNDHRTGLHGKEVVLNRISEARFRVLKRVQDEQLRLTQEAKAAAEAEQREREAVARGRFVQEWLDKPREEVLVVPEEWDTTIDREQYHPEFTLDRGGDA